MCCPRQLATRTFGIRSGRLVETGTELTGTASLSMLDGTEWVLRELAGQQDEPPPEGATLTFSSGEVSGSSGCNQFRGTVEDGASATGLVIGPLATTRKLCPDALMARELRFLEVLGRAETFRFRFGDLVLRATTGSLVFAPRVD
jgi:heat shock protein HslJ